MACSDVKLACCRLCGKAIASDLGACIHCGVCDPVRDDKCNWLQRTLVILLILGTILATLRYEAGGDAPPDCGFGETERSRDC